MESRDRKVNLTGMAPYYFDKREIQQPKKQSSADEEGFDKILEHERSRIREELEHGLKIPAKAKRN